jgi:Protein of unknown function (DUF1064)
MNKYKNKPTNGYASKHEAQVGADLEALAKSGHIMHLTKQHTFVLIPSQRGKIRNERPVTYIADFVYSDHLGRRHVADAKGMKTDVYVLKRKLMLLIHGIEVEEL